ncbi:hypothetical protein [Archangium sp.]|uniref:hypothetical protein n=1 Tax=Archangium sp. TaxID=1872627 RepID=UPI002D6DFDA5|nr:hypothetical protein [Archangium sp.]HYO56977.1 hypothetical protein [Archangium sp.]
MHLSHLRRGRSSPLFFVLRALATSGYLLRDHHPWAALTVLSGARVALMDRSHGWEGSRATGLAVRWARAR